MAKGPDGQTRSGGVHGVHAGPSANRLGSLWEHFTGILKGTLLKHDVPLHSVDPLALVNFMTAKKKKKMIVEPLGRLSSFN